MSTILTPAEKAAIRGRAAGDKAHLELAQAAYDRAVREHGVECCVEVQFMSEVLAPVPDLLLRANYRAALLA